MRTIIAGSRDITNYDDVLESVIDSNFQISQILSGGARGVDTIAIQIAKDFNIPYIVYNAHWEQYGKAAGFIRNELMAKSADALIAAWDGKSAGTKHMITIAKQLKLKVYIG